jgi:ATP-dependent Clp protease protease subunit
MRGQVTEMEIEYKLIKALQKELYDIMAKHTGQSYETIFKDCERDNWMTAEESKTYGLVDEVLVRKSPKA